VSDGIDRREILKGATAATIMALLRGESAATSPAPPSASGRAFAANQMRVALKLALEKTLAKIVDDPRGFVVPT